VGIEGAIYTQKVLPVLNLLYMYFCHYLYIFTAPQTKPKLTWFQWRIKVGVTDVAA